MPRRLKCFNVGDRVYARFFGNDMLLVEKTFKTKSGFVHYVCSTGRSKYAVPGIHLSTRPLMQVVGDGNRRQLELFG